MKYEVLVVGGGHAGCEAAHASARMGLRTALITLNADRIGFMSCNPAIGGLAKGQLVKEIDALGGVMGMITDKTAIQYRRLNSSKGPAVRSSRAQCDKALYAVRMQEYLRSVPLLDLVQAEVSEIITERDRVTGLRLGDGSVLDARAVVITSGTFLKALMYTGFEASSGGRVGDSAASQLSESIAKLGFKLGRLKTGTPPRLDTKSIDYSQLEPQPGDEVPIPFSFYYRGTRFPELPQISCHITYTNPRTHDIIEANFDQSPMFTGLIHGVGPRYCPSIEDKVKRFRDKDRHQIFLEPEGLTTDEVYVNGMSTSLPASVQEEFIHSIVGLENAKFIRYGYAVEYDAVDARQLKLSLESKDISGLFFAGQVNGTSGYEEAGAQGLIAGINAAQLVKEQEPLLLGRNQGYLGVLVDDLVLKGVDEPYRMFTSRAEFRLLLREDNADLRLSELGHRVGLLNNENFERFEAKRSQIEALRTDLSTRYIMPTEANNLTLEAHAVTPLKDRVSAETLMRRPEVSWPTLQALGSFDSSNVSAEVLEQVEIQIKYAGYIQRDLDLMEGVRKHDAMRIPAKLDYAEIAGLSTEIRNRLTQVRPETIGQVGRIQGVTPAAVATLMIYLKMQENRSNRESQRA